MGNGEFVDRDELPVNGSSWTADMKVYLMKTSYFWPPRWPVNNGPPAAVNLFVPWQEIAEKMG
jgi:hypothetical protein